MVVLDDLVDVFFVLQTLYMPSTEPVPTCPASLLPSEEWEREVVSTFVDLRQVSQMAAVQQRIAETYIHRGGRGYRREGIAGTDVEEARGGIPYRRQGCQREKADV